MDVVLRALSWLPHTYWPDIDNVIGGEESKDSLTVDPFSSARASGDKARIEAEEVAEWFRGDDARRAEAAAVAWDLGELALEDSDRAIARVSRRLGLPSPTQKVPFRPRHTSLY